MGKKRVYELAKELSIPSKELVNLAQRNKMDIASHMAVLETSQIQQLTKLVQQQTTAKIQNASKAAVKQHPHHGGSEKN